MNPTDSTSTANFSVEVIYPKQNVFTCPVYNNSFSIYSSWTRHLSEKHPRTKIEKIFRCLDCERTFDSRRSISNHHSKTHGKATATARGNEAGEYICEFCDDHFPAKRSLGQHIRNQHAAEASHKRALEWQSTRINRWSPEEHQMFVDALNALGPGSNVAIARRVGTKSAKQVGVHKRIYLRDHPETQLQTSAVNQQDAASQRDSYSKAPPSQEDQRTGQPPTTPLPPNTSQISVLDHQETILPSVTVPENPPLPGIILEDSPSQNSVSDQQDSLSSGLVLEDSPSQNSEARRTGQDAASQRDSYSKAPPSQEDQRTGQPPTIPLPPNTSQISVLDHQETILPSVTVPENPPLPGIILEDSPSQNSVPDQQDSLSSGLVLEDSPSQNSEARRTGQDAASQRDSYSKAPPSQEDQRTGQPPTTPLPPNTSQISVLDHQETILPSVTVPENPPLPGIILEDSPSQNSVSDQQDSLSSGLVLEDSPSQNSEARRTGQSPIRAPSPSTVLEDPPSRNPLLRQQATPSHQAEQTNASPSHENQRQRTTQPWKKRIADLMTKCNQQCTQFVDCQLSPPEWAHFEKILDDLMTKLKACRPSRPATHPTTNWRSRQRRRQSSQPNPNTIPAADQPQPNQNEDHNRSDVDSSQRDHNRVDIDTTQRDHSRSKAPGSDSSQRHNRSERRRRAREAKKVQRWYRNNKKKCVRHILKDESPRCEIPLSDLSSYFSTQPLSTSTKPVPGFVPQNEDPGASQSEDELVHPITMEEIKHQLRRMPLKSAAGPDGITYEMWKWNPEAEHLLMKVFNICMTNKRIPGQWKESLTILIYKKGDRTVPSNWRPISLQSTIYKIYAAILARGLADWAIANGKINPAQKGFLPFEGCAEHSFILRSVIEDSKRRNRNVTIVWLDLKNAFGSVPHNTMWDMMKRIAIPTDFLHICRDIYLDSSQVIRSTAGTTPSIPLNQGIKQGCPLSPLLFNIVLEGVIPRMTQFKGYTFKNGTKTSCLAFADDLCLITSTTQEAQQMVSSMKQFFDWAGLQLNPTKCGSLTMINNRKNKFVAPFSPKIDNSQAIPHLNWEDSYKYLGIKVGRERQSLDNMTKSIINDAEEIGKSALTEWQKIEAIRMFVLSRTNYILDTALPPLTWATKLDAKIRQIIKGALRLPKRTIGAFIHTPNNMGGLGIPSILDNLHIARITRVLKCLNSRDKIVNDIAWSQLHHTVKQRRRLDDVQIADISDFINHPPLPRESRARVVQSIWSTVRKSLIYTDTKMELTNTGAALRTGSLTGECPPRALRNCLRQACEQKWLKTLLDAPRPRTHFYVSPYPLGQ